MYGELYDGIWINVELKSGNTVQELWLPRWIFFCMLGRFDEKNISVYLAILRGGYNYGWWWGSNIRV